MPGGEGHCISRTREASFMITQARFKFISAEVVCRTYSCLDVAVIHCGFVEYRLWFFDHDLRRSTSRKATWQIDGPKHAKIHVNNPIKRLDPHVECEQATLASIMLYTFLEFPGRGPRVVII